MVSNIVEINISNSIGKINSYILVIDLISNIDHKVKIWMPIPKLTPVNRRNLLLDIRHSHFCVNPSINKGAISRNGTNIHGNEKEIITSGSS